MIPIKNGKEIEKMRQACRTASEILDALSDLVRPGISTKEVDEAAGELMEEAGALQISEKCALHSGFFH